MVRVFSSTQLFTTSAWNPACILATASSPLPNGSFTRCTFGYCSVKDLMYAGANPSLYEKSLRVPEIAAGPAEPPGGAELEPPPQAEAMSAAAVTTANGPNRRGLLACFRIAGPTFRFIVPLPLVAGHPGTSRSARPRDRNDPRPGERPDRGLRPRSPGPADDVAGRPHPAKGAPARPAAGAPGASARTARTPRGSARCPITGRARHGTRGRAGRRRLRHRIEPPPRSPPAGSEAARDRRGCEPRRASGRRVPRSPHGAHRSRA